MSRFRVPAAAGPPLALGALALAVAALGLVAAACSSSGGHHAATATASTPRSSAPCKLNRTQRRAVARALADIRRLRRIQAPMHTFSQHGAPNQNAVTGMLMLDLGSASLPLNVYAHLLHLGKAAVTLCGDCSQGLEADEPFLGNRGQTHHC
jgi:Flp pilus assembly protein TadB